MKKILRASNGLYPIKAKIIAPQNKVRKIAKIGASMNINWELLPLGTILINTSSHHHSKFFYI